MGRRRVTVDGLADAVQGILEQYANNVEDAMAPVLKKTAQTGRAELRATSPKKTGDYAKGWQYSASEDGLHYRIYNGTEYRLTHLLEHGHVIRNGTKRKYGFVPAREHIAPVDEKVIEQLPDAIIAAIEKA